MLYWLYSALGNFPFVETIIFFALALITVFRKELSSNDAYRNPSNPNKLPSLPSMPNVPSLDSLHQISLDDCKIALANTVEVAKDTLEGAGSQGSQAFHSAWDKYVSPVLEGNNLHEMSDMQEFKVTKRSTARNRSLLSQLSEDILIKLVNYLNNREICALSAVSKQFSQIMKSDLVWENLWIKTYGAMWQSPAISTIREQRRILWDPFANWGPPGQGWFLFYLQFEICWMDWLLAGMCTPSKCLVGLNYSIYDVTKFVPLHPGSPEVLLDFSGFDATTVYNDIGHSNQAQILARQYLLWGRHPDCEITDQVDVLSTDNDLTSGDGDDDGARRNSFTRRNRGRQSGRGRSRIQHRSLFNQNDDMYWMNRCPVNTKSLLYQHMKTLQKTLKEDAETREESSDSFDSFDGITELIHSASISLGNRLGSTLESVGITFGSSSSSISSTIGNISIENGMTMMSSNLSNSITAESLSSSHTTAMTTHVENMQSSDIGLSSTTSSSSSSSSTTIPQDMDRATLPVDPNDTHTHHVVTGNTTLLQTPNTTKIDSRRLVPTLASSYSSPACCHSLGCNHSGQVRVMFDPIEQRWVVWWSCCGIGYQEE